MCSMLLSERNLRDIGSASQRRWCLSYAERASHNVTQQPTIIECRALNYVSDRRPAIRTAESPSQNRRHSFFLNAAFCCLVLFASPIGCMRKLVGAVGIEFSVNLISPADSVAFALSIPPKIQPNGLVLWSRCGQIPSARGP
jgi:hypothetical protein